MHIYAIKTEADYQRALHDINALMEAAPESEDGERLDILVTLVDAYGSKHHPIDAPDPIQLIQFVMEQQGLARKDLEQYIGTRARVAEILNYKRPLTLPMIRRLHTGLGISADVLIQPQSAPPSSLH